MSLRLVPRIRTQNLGWRFQEVHARPLRSQVWQFCEYGTARARFVCIFTDLAQILLNNAISWIFAPFLNNWNILAHMVVDVMMSGTGSFLQVPQKGPCGDPLRPEASFTRQTPSTWRT